MKGVEAVLLKFNIYKPLSCLVLVVLGILFISFSAQAKEIVKPGKFENKPSAAPSPRPEPVDGKLMQELRNNVHLSFISLTSRQDQQGRNHVYCRVIIENRTDRNLIFYSRYFQVLDQRGNHHAMSIRRSSREGALPAVKTGTGFSIQPQLNKGAGAVSTNSYKSPWNISATRSIGSVSVPRNQSREVELYAILAGDAVPSRMLVKYRDAGVGSAPIYR